MEKLLSIIEEVLNIKKGELSLSSIIKEIDEWDSLANVQIIAEIEEQFNTSIPLEDIEKIEKVNDFMRYI